MLLSKKTIEISRKKRASFTLAEVLVVFTIIGVVACFTIPTLTANVQNFALREAAKTGTAVLMQAANKVISDNGGNINGVFNDSNDFKNALMQYLVTQKSCTLANAMGTDKCYHYNFRLLNDLDYAWSADLSAGSAGFVLNNGMLVLIYGGASGTQIKTCTMDGFAGYCAGLSFDVNGWKGPNKLGYDIFYAQVLVDRAVPSNKSLSYFAADTCIYPPNAGWSAGTNGGETCISNILIQ